MPEARGVKRAGSAQRIAPRAGGTETHRGPATGFKLGGNVAPPACKISSLKRIAIHVQEAELARVRRAARLRSMSVSEFVKEVAILRSDEDLAAHPVELDPFGRKAATVHRLRK